MKKPEVRYLVMIVIVVALLLAVLFWPKAKEKKLRIDFSSDATISSIGELATVRGFYHNVARLETQAEEFVNDWLLWPFGGYTRIGYKQHWMEYDGVVEIGIDVDQLRIEGPDENGVVRVFIPDARVLNDYWDKNSTTETYSETGLFTDISYDEKNAAYVKAKETMRQSAENDRVMLARAKNNAKLLIENYIINTGKTLDMNLTVEWIDT